MTVRPHAATMRRIGVGIVLAFLGAIGVTVLLLFAWPFGEEAAPPYAVALVPASDIAIGDATVLLLDFKVSEVDPEDVRDSAFSVYVVRLPSGELRAFDRRSTDGVRRCHVVWRNSDHPPPGYRAGFYFEAPCLGSRFQYDGTRVFGPAYRDLDRVHVEVRDGLVVVDPTRITRSGDAPGIER